MLPASLTRTLATIFVVIAVAFAVPVGQLHTVDVHQQCCCQNPESCDCPRELASAGHHAALNPCHHTTQLTLNPTVAGFPLPVATGVVARDASVAILVHTLAAPHDPSSLRRPDAPS